jgi:hypothetical protein
MSKKQHNENEINIGEIQEEQDREINNYYYNSETFFETFCNEYYYYIDETIKFIVFGLFWKK